MSTGRYKINSKADENGVLISLMIFDEESKANEIPLTEMIDKNKLVEILGLDETVRLIKNGEMSETANDILAPYFVEAVLPFEKQFLQLRKIEEILESFGYDGFQYQNENEGAGISYAVFNDEQIIKKEKMQKEDIKRSVMRKPRVQTAEEALEHYRKSGDEKDLPNPTWIGQFRRDAKNRAEYFAGQISGTEFDLTYHAKTEEEDLKAAEMSLLLFAYIVSIGFIYFSTISKP